MVDPDLFALREEARAAVVAGDQRALRGRERHEEVAGATLAPTFPTFQALGVAVLASASVKEAFQRLVRHSRIVSDATEYRLEDAADRCRLTFAIAPGGRARARRRCKSSTPSAASGC